MEYKIGDRVRIVSNEGGVGFLIGEVVVIKGIDSENYFAVSPKGEGWYVCDNNIQAVTADSSIVNPVIERCACCCEILEEEGKETQDGQVCRSCFDDDYFCCAQCEGYFNCEDSISLGDECYCSTSCANDARWYLCADCDEWYYAGDSSGQNSAGEGVCGSCADNYSSCEGCSDIVHCDDSHYSEQDGCTYCDSCWHENDCNHVIKSYGYRPREFVFSKMEYENTVYLGIELEVEAGRNNASELACKVKAWMDKKGVGELVYIKEDGSLNNGFELVWHPITLKAIHSKFPMRQFLSYLQELKLTSHKGGTCGLHVHLSRRKMTDTDIYRGKLFFYKCALYLKKLSARKDGLSGVSDDKVFAFCKFDEEMPSSYHNGEAGRYCVFNTCNSSTVEIRLFRGTLIYDRFQASLQFSDCFGEYIQRVGVPYLKRERPSIIWQGFLDYAKKSCKYSQMIKYVLKKGIV